MTRVIDLYGVLEGRLEQVAGLLTQAVGLRFQRRSSDFWGDYYTAHSEDRQEKLDLRENFNKIEGELTWPDYEKYPLMVEVVVQSVARSREIESRIMQALGSKAALLRRKEYTK